ncbi:ATP-binding cassette, subfamily B [Paenibacillus sp. UNCCL117]|uniref:ABC transporter ATP-binding protein n=1 Tax=unclassified Paenibacillus TaxID=185978 RepID=UPI00087E79FB|nr:MULTISPECIES: ABC transporter ATP-binding protein [unclassified Paenibacillus]SDE46496.1 ATP-binding cassette, subfamily B [Paenibacillus sp. cl123]SFW65844.1 ATP-binding cassette, subfamily B [Paenibacillus sp. UNCCL117]
MAEPGSSGKQSQTSPHAGPPLMGGMGPGGGPGRGPVPKVRAKHTWATVRRLWGYLSRQRGGLITVFLLTLFSSGLALAGPYLIGRAIDEFILAQDRTGLLWLCAGLLTVYALSSVMSWLQAYVMAGVTQQTVMTLRRDLFERFQQLPLQFFDSRTHGELMSRATNDIENVSGTLNQSVTQLVTSLVTIVGSLILMLSLNLTLTLVSLVSIPLVILLTGQITKRTRKLFKSQQTHLGELNGFIEETMTGQKVVKAYRREKPSIRRFGELNDQLNQVGKRAQIVSGMMGPVMNVVNNTSFALIATVGGWMALGGMTTIGVIVSFLNYSKQFSRPINELANQYNLLQSAIAGAERVFEILDMPSEFQEMGKAGQIDKVRGEVVFDRVSFRYQESNPILSDISFTAKPGDTIALVGPTGAGKTTIVNLLTRFYEIQEGTITVDGRNIRELDKSSLRSKLGIVLQDAYLFSDTIIENIRYGKPGASLEEVKAAAKLANADSFIVKLPHGYDTKLMAEGGNLSHGQRQLLTIARAILANPSILILDEATSSVDTRTEMHIQDAMKTLMKGRTSFVIAHRLSTIREADLILVLRGGRIIERGTHQELLDSRGFYHDLYTGQFQQAN